ncbi:hypothetical protein CSOJ01_02716 [Colletotrichum sojae]|uniref:Uncharacterized protein n=1 Tax=Colletotrichum sojae TaxID=2175907 RepID=A0A8H6JPL5_9PEZI|nr:hypothetical protein CSOJ01_02716 [Colletotrichum sojae]
MSADPEFGPAPDAPRRSGTRYPVHTALTRANGLERRDLFQPPVLLNFHLWRPSRRPDSGDANGVGAGIGPSKMSGRDTNASSPRGWGHHDAPILGSQRQFRENRKDVCNVVMLLLLFFPAGN